MHAGCHGRLPPTLLPIEDVAARNRQYVRLGDCILLQAKRSEHLLSVASAEGMHLVGGGARREVRLVYKERAGGGVGLAHGMYVHVYNVNVQVWSILCSINFLDHIVWRQIEYC